MTTQNLRNPLDRSRLRSGLLFIALAFGYFALSPAPNAFGVVPAPDGGYPGNNTAEGANALFSLTSGIDNTALGFQALYRNNTATGVQALFSNTTGNYNAALGVNALYRNTTGRENTATGVNALFNNTTANFNTALGTNTLYRNTTGAYNTATGWEALFNNTTGDANTATGAGALLSNTTGDLNTAIGESALYSNTTGFYNTATGDSALVNNISGFNNTACGLSALGNNTYGSNNIALGSFAGDNLTTGSNNIHIGNSGFTGESNTIRIGAGPQTATYISGISGKTATNGAAVFVTFNGKLGTVTSSRRFKKDIADMDTASNTLLALRPVTFRYKPELDKAGIPQYGLVAEEVAEVNPDLVVRDEKGEIYTVRYEAVNAMLLNEFLKEHRTVQEQQATIIQLTKQMETVIACLKEQDSKIQKVSVQVGASKFATRRIRRGGPTPQVALNNQ
jgi:hypothetical protein